MLSQSTAALRVSRNYSKVAYLKQSNLFIFFLSFFFSQPSVLTREVTELKQP